MIQRSIAIVLALVAVCLMVTSAQAKAVNEKPQHGTIVSIAGSKLVVNVKADKNDKVGTEKSFDVSPTVSVTVNGQPGKIEDIKAGDKIGFRLDNGGKMVTDITKGKKPKA